MGNPKLTHKTKERTLIKRVRVVPQSWHLAFLWAMFLPQLKHKVMCLQLLPYRSEVEPHPPHDAFNVRSIDIFVGPSESKEKIKAWRKRRLFSRVNALKLRSSFWSLILDSAQILDPIGIVKLNCPCNVNI